MNLAFRGFLKNIPAQSVISHPVMRRFIKSLSYALAGIKVAVGEQRNIQIHLTILLLVIATGLLLDINLNEWLAVILAAAIVISTEMINTAIEKTVDLASPEIHPLAKQAKDIAAGAVLVSVLFAIIIGLLVFGKYLLQFLSDYL
jgi:diacylglycerol kinase